MFRNMEKEKLIENEDFKLVGFYEDTGMFADFLDILQPVYLINQKYYVLILSKTDLDHEIKRMYGIYCDVGPDPEGISKHFQSVKFYIQKEEFWEREYVLKEKTVGCFFKIEEVSNDRLIKQQDPITLESSTYIGAVRLPDGNVVVGDFEFLEKVIEENVDDLEERYKLLDMVYYNHQDYYKREELLNDIYYNHYEELSPEVRYKIYKEKPRTAFIAYGLRVMESIRDEAIEVKIKHI